MTTYALVYVNEPITKKKISGSIQFQTQTLPHSSSLLPPFPLSLSSAPTDPTSFSHTHDHDSRAHRHGAARRFSLRSSRLVLSNETKSQSVAARRRLQAPEFQVEVPRGIVFNFCNLDFSFRLSASTQSSLVPEYSSSMADIDGVSVLPKPAPTDDKLVFVRVKRKAYQSRLDAFWLEINERPAKRPLLDFDKLCISDSSSSAAAAAAKEELKTKKVLVQHVETIGSSESTIDIVQSFVPHSADVLASKTKMDERRSTFKKENKQDQLLSKAKQKQEVLAKNARFEQIWRSRKGNEEALLDKSLHEMCRFYDIVRVEVEEKSNGMQQQEDMSLEDQRLLCSYLPLLRDLIPSAAEEIESDMSSFMSKQASEDEYVYDVYTVKNDQDMNDEESPNPFPLVQVDDEDFYDGPDDSDCESDDSNAENNPQNDYPDEISEEEDQDEEKSSEEDESSSKSSDSDDIADGVEDAIYDDYGDHEYNQDFDFSDVQEWR